MTDEQKQPEPAEPQKKVIDIHPLAAALLEAEIEAANVDIENYRQKRMKEVNGVLVAIARSHGITKRQNFSVSDDNLHFLVF